MKKEIHHLAIAIIGCCLFSHASSAADDFAGQVLRRGAVQLTGWVQLRGELMIYDSRASMEDGLRYPHCVSGVFKNQADMKLSSYDLKKVTIIGTLFRYADLPNEENSILPRKILSGTAIPNSCFGDNVLLIKEIVLVSSSK